MFSNLRNVQRAWPYILKCKSSLFLGIAHFFASFASEEDRKVVLLTNLLFTSPSLPLPAPFLLSTKMRKYGN